MAHNIEVASRLRVEAEANRLSVNSKELK